MSTSEAESRARRIPLAATPSEREQQVLDRIDKARRRRAKVKEERITLSHGAGGKATQTLIEAVFLDAFRNPLLEPLEDAAEFTIQGTSLALTTDSYVVHPLFFPGESEQRSDVLLVLVGSAGGAAADGTALDGEQIRRAFQVAFLAR